MKFSMSNRDLVGSGAALDENSRNIVIHDDNGEEIVLELRLDADSGKLIISQEGGESVLDIIVE